MVNLIFYLFFLLILLIFLVSFSIYSLFLIYSSLKGSPFVPTEDKKINQILALAGLKKNQVFYDLGCGDGRVVIEAVKNFKVKGIGIDINPLLIKIAKLKSKIKKIPSEKINFLCQDILKTNLKNGDYIYLFLMPKLIERLKPKLAKLKKGTIIISHGFKIENWESKLIKEKKDRPFSTYYYQITK